MKKFIGKILVALMVMSPLAAADVTLSWVQNGTDLELHYLATVGTNCVGLGVDIDVSTNTVILSGVTTTAAMPLHIDYINEHNGGHGGEPALTLDGTTGVVIADAAHPSGSHGIADTALAGTEDPTTGTDFCISLAVLGGILPEGSDGILATLQGSCPTNGGQSVGISLNTIRSGTGAVASGGGDVVVNLPGSGTFAACCTEVPDVDDLSEAQAIIDLDNAGFTNNTAGTPEYHATVPVGDVISSSPSGCLDTSTLITYILSLGPAPCYDTTSGTFYTDFLAYGSPDCWCYIRQCHGDANGKIQGTPFAGFVAVGTADLAIFGPNYGILDPAGGFTPSGPGLPLWPATDICADFSHSKAGTPFAGFSRVNTVDLGEFSTWYGILQPAGGFTPSGPGTPEDCPRIITPIVPL